LIESLILFNQYSGVATNVNTDALLALCEKITKIHTLTKGCRHIINWLTTGQAVGLMIKISLI
jgi:hypothetical protein